MKSSCAVVVLTREEAEKYKKPGPLHEPDVECLGNGGHDRGELVDGSQVHEKYTIGETVTQCCFSTLPDTINRVSPWLCMVGGRGIRSNTVVPCSAIGLGID